MTHPYKLEKQRLIATAAENRWRYAITLSFLEERLGTAPIPGATALDIGERNPLTEQIEKLLGLSLDSTEGDLDEVSIPGRYDYVFSFEVLEHLFNPLWHMKQIRNCLNPGGRVFLSTPVGKPHFLWSLHHFHELHPREFRSLVECAGLRIETLRMERIRPWAFYFTGLRPFARLFFERIFLAELRAS
jgi:SAM-dependent methyltransferase